MTAQILKPFHSNGAAVRDESRPSPPSAASRQPRPVPDHLWRRYLAGGVAAVVVYFLLARFDLAQALVFVAIQLSGLVAVAVGVRRNRVRHRLPWVVIAGGGCLCTIANVVWYPYTLAVGAKLGFPSIADVLYIPAYVAILVGIAMLMWRRGGKADRASVLDAAIVTVGVGGLSWEFLMRPSLGHSGLSVLERLFSLTYPTMNLLLLAVLMLIAFLRGARPAAFWLLLVGGVLNLVADTGFVLASLKGSIAFGAAYFAGWLLFYVLLGTAALHPSVRALSAPAPVPEPVLGRSRLAFLAGSALVAPTVMIVQGLRGAEADHVVLSLLSAVLFVLVLTRMSGLMTDVSRHRQTEKVKDEFISVVSHELRTPLTSIRGALGLLAGGVLGPLPEKGQRMLEIAAANTDRLVRLINDILDIERMESGKVTMSKDLCDAATLVNRAAEEMQAMASEAGIELAVEARPVTLVADPDRLVQLLTNLMSNAIKFSPAGSTVRVSDRRQGGDVVFEVEDHGRGIPSDKLESIFGRFQQVDASDSRHKGGTGLGLAICHTIAQQHGGHIWVESAPGEGSTFSVTVPAVDESVLPGPDAVVSTGGPTVVVCHDDSEGAEMVSLLSGRGYRVVTARDGEQVLEEAARHSPDAIVLDLFMAGTSGPGTLAALKQRPETAHIPVMLLSGLVMVDQGTPSDHYVECLDRPASQDTLFDALRDALGPRHGRATALLIEDDADVARVLTTTFEHHGLATLHGQCGQQAVALASRVPPDLLVLDVMLPGGDGFEVVDTLRQDERLPRVPLVVYTAGGLDDSGRRRLQLGDTLTFAKGTKGATGRLSSNEVGHRLAQLLEHVTGAQLPEEART